MPSREYRLLPGVELEIPISLLEIKPREERLWISTDPIVTAAFPPCIKNMIQKVKAEKGRYRRAAILASFLGQSGWKNAEAKSLWLDAVAVEERIFAEWFGKMHCPKCETMQQQSRGLPGSRHCRPRTLPAGRKVPWICRPGGVCCGSGGGKGLVQRQSNADPNHLSGTSLRLDHRKSRRDRAIPCRKG